MRASPNVPIETTDLSIVGPRLWAELHRHALSLPEALIEKTLRLWLDDFARRIPCGQCRQEWRSMLARTPVELGSKDDYFAWTVARHNEVNARLGKPQMTAADARRHWLEAAP